MVVCSFHIIYTYVAARETFCVILLLLDWLLDDLLYWLGLGLFEDLLFQCFVSTHVLRIFLEYYNKGILHLLYKVLLHLNITVLKYNIRIRPDSNTIFELGLHSNLAWFEYNIRIRTAFECNIRIRTAFEYNIRIQHSNTIFDYNIRIGAVFEYSNTEIFILPYFSPKGGSYFTLDYFRRRKFPTTYQLFGKYF